MTIDALLTPLLWQLVALMAASHGLVFLAGWLLRMWLHPSRD